MSKMVTLNIYAVVDENGEYSVHTASMSDASSAHEDDFGTPEVAGYYHLELEVPLPQVQTVKLSASTPGRQPLEGFGSVARVTFTPDGE